MRYGGADERHTENPGECADLHRLPFGVKEYGSGSDGRHQRTVAIVDAVVNLLPDARGTHMSRFIAILHDEASPRHG